MPAAATIGPRGLAQLSAAAFIAAAVMLAATASYGWFLGGGGAAWTILIVVAVSWALLGVYILHAVRKPERRLEPPPRRPAIVEPLPIEVLPPGPDDERPQQRY